MYPTTISIYEVNGTAFMHIFKSHRHTHKRERERHWPMTGVGTNKRDDAKNVHPITRLTQNQLVYRTTDTWKHQGSKRLKMHIKYLWSQIRFAGDAWKGFNDQTKNSPSRCCCCWCYRNRFCCCCCSTKKSIREFKILSLSVFVSSRNYSIAVSLWDLTTSFSLNAKYSSCKLIYGNTFFNTINTHTNQHYVTRMNKNNLMLKFLHIAPATANPSISHFLHIFINTTHKNLHVKLFNPFLWTVCVLLHSLHLHFGLICDMCVFFVVVVIVSYLCKYFSENFSLKHLKRSNNDNIGVGTEYWSTRKDLIKINEAISVLSLSPGFEEPVSDCISI